MKLNDFILLISDTTKKYRFERFLRYKGYLNPETDIIKFFNLIIEDPIWFKNLNIDSYKCINTKKNLISTLRTIWNMDIIKNHTTEENHKQVLKELNSFYNSIVEPVDNVIKNQLEDIKIKMNELQSLIDSLSENYNNILK